MRVLTSDHLKAWRQVDPDNWRSIVLEIYDVFLNSEMRKFGEIVEAWKVRDFERVSRTAHSLKSSCGNVGAERASALLHEIEHFAMHGRANELRIAVRRLEEIFPQTILALAAQKEELQAA